METDPRVHAIMASIDQLYGDVSIPWEDCVLALEEIEYHIRVSIDALKENHDDA